MKNLLIGKSFSYEIVDFTFLWQSNTYHLGGDRSIQLSYEDLYKKLANEQIFSTFLLIHYSSGKLIKPCSQITPLKRRPI